jgi:hypothetical protein
MYILVLPRAPTYYLLTIWSRGEHGQASPWTDMDGHGHGRTDGRPWTAIKINKASAGPLAPKIGILTILMSPITLQLFFMPSDYGVVLLW